MSLKLRELIALQHKNHGPRRLLGNVGDGMLYQHNAVFRRVRDAALAHGFGFTTEDPGDYFAFPLVALDVVLERRQIPYRANFAALEALERRRPGFFTLADLKVNRPAPNYLLHESAHAIAFAQAWEPNIEVTRAFSDPKSLPRIMLAEAFAMTAEYFAAAEIVGPTFAWVFSLNSYRDEVPGKSALSRLAAAHGRPLVTWTLLAAFLHTNYRIEALDQATVDRVLASPLSPARARMDGRTREQLRGALNRAMRMNEDFTTETARLFLTSVGYPRDLGRVLSGDPLLALERDPRGKAAVRALVGVLAAAPSRSVARAAVTRDARL